MLCIGSHVGMGKPDYYLGSVKEALSYGANTFMFYTGAPQNSMRKPVNELKVAEALDLMNKNNIVSENVIVHAPYLINLANMDESKYSISLNMLIVEMERTKAMGCKYLVLHPGSCLNFDRNESLKQVATLLNIALSKVEGVTILLETMAGKGSEIGKTFEEIAFIISLINKKDSIGVCLDTCHINDAGYDLSDSSKILNDFNNVIGLDYLKVVHVNDSKNLIGSHKDRHANIGYGTIGFNNLINFIYNPLISNRIFILETPYIDGFPPYKFEIASLQNKEFNNTLVEDIKNYYGK